MTKLLILLFLVSCGEQERPEQLLKLRALGARLEPVVGIPSSSSQATFYFAAEQGKKADLKIASVLDEGASYSLPQQSTIDSASLTEEVKGGISLYYFKAQWNVPAQIFDTLIEKKIPKVAVRFGVEAILAQEQEKVIGDQLVFVPTSKEVAWKNPNIQITSIDDNQEFTSGSNISISGEITSFQDETYRIGWYVSQGEVKNRRALKTEWKLPSQSGPQTIFLTVRGTKTGSFQITSKVINIK